jgi:hypothetical protein
MLLSLYPYGVPTTQGSNVPSGYWLLVTGVWYPCFVITSMSNLPPVVPNVEALHWVTFFLI